MLSKELIKQLQEIDPEGNIPVCVYNVDISELTLLPAYYDGRLQQIEWEQDSNGEHKPKSGFRTSIGNKIWIETRSLKECYDWNKDFVIKYENDSDKAQYEDDDLSYTRMRKEVKYKVDMESFIDWVFKKCQDLRTVHINHIELIKKTAKDFYEKEQMRPNFPLVQGQNGKSYHESRIESLERNVSVVWDQYGRILINWKENV